MRNVAKAPCRLINRISVGTGSKPSTATSELHGFCIRIKSYNSGPGSFRNPSMQSHELSALFLQPSLPRGRDPLTAFDDPPGLGAPYCPRQMNSTLKTQKSLHKTWHLLLTCPSGTIEILVLLPHNGPSGRQGDPAALAPPPV